MTTAREPGVRRRRWRAGQPGGAQHGRQAAGTDQLRADTVTTELAVPRTTASASRYLSKLDE